LPERFGPFDRCMVDRYRGNLQAVFMPHWHDTMVDTPETDGAVYVTGRTISGLAELGTIVAYGLSGFRPAEAIAFRTALR